MIQWRLSIPLDIAHSELPALASTFPAENQPSFAWLRWLDQVDVVRDAEIASKRLASRSCELAENRSVGGNVDSERQDQRRRKGHPEIEWRVRIGSDSLIRAGIRKDAPYHRCADLVAAFRSKYTLSIVPPAVKIVIGMLAPLLFATTGIKPPLISDAVSLSRTILSEQRSRRVA